jgi:hypothetical protein
MSDTILSGDFTVYYLAENRQKRVVWTGSATGTRTVNQLYSALADLMDDLNQMDDGSVMSAQTPTQYTLGLIDPSDTEPWYIDRTSVEHLTGGALTTVGWSRVTTSKVGIVRVPYTIGTDFILSDIGKTITNATSTATGTLLDFNTIGAIKYMWIRPATFAAGNDWSGSVGTVTVTAGSAASVTQSGPAVTGDGLWANLFSLGTIVTPGTHLMAYQGTQRVLSYKSTTIDWWPDGQIDMLLPTKELGNYLDGLATPVNAAFSTATGGGTLAAGTYYYRVTALNAQGETIASVETSQVTTGATSTVTVNWTAVTGATGYKIYGRSTGAELFMQTVGAVTTWIDTGSVTPAGALPTVNTTGGYVTVLARQYDQTYTDYTANVQAGGRNPIPLAAGSDLNNTTGFREITGSAGTGTFVVGEIIYVGASLGAATKAAIVTKVAGTGAAPVLDYYIIMAAGTGLFTDFANTDAVKGNTSAATCTAAAPINVGPSVPAITIVYGANNTFDIPQNGTNQGYSIVIDLLTTQTVAQGYEFTKYLTRPAQGTNAQLPTGVPGESYIGEDYRILYATITGTINVGDVVTQLVSGAVGTVVANNTAPTAGSKYLILRNSRGTFDSTNAVQKDSSNFVSTPTSTPITPIHAAPFGTFAGGTWFCAPGVVLKNYLASDTNKFQLVDDTGVVRKAPTSVTALVSNTRLLDAVSVFKLTAAGGTIQKAQYAATVQAIGATAAIVGSAITADTPGKTAGGVLRLVQGNAEYRTRYNSWSASTFTLAARTGLAATAGTNTTNIFASAALFVTWGILVGDVVRNVTRGLIGYVSAVISETQLQITNTPIAGQVSGDSFEINTLPVATTAADSYYVPIIDVSETAGTDVSPGSQSRSLVYVADVPVIVRVRHIVSGDPLNIQPFESPSTITVSGMSVPAIRTKDTIAT